MWRYYLLLLCLTHGDTEQPEAGDDSTESWNCTAKNVEVLKGKTLKLISPLDATGGDVSGFTTRNVATTTRRAEIASITRNQDVKRTMILK